MLTGIIGQAWKRPLWLAYAAGVFLSQRDRVRRRREMAARGVEVPAFLIYSVTKNCNLNCAGCYSHAQDKPNLPDLPDERLLEVCREASDMGVSFILLAGGEPLVRKAVLLDAARQCPEIIFPVFTNGLLADADFIRQAKSWKNIIPVLSMEGGRYLTDDRRGNGVYERGRAMRRDMKKAGLFYAVSLTVTSKNRNELTDSVFLKELVREGCGLFFFVEYVPVKEGSENLVLNDAERADLLSRLGDLKKTVGATMIAFPGDEEEFGGCLAAGKGFVHIASDGSLEPCPFAPFSDVNLREKSLAEALGSKFLAKVRAEEGLHETAGGCALWKARDRMAGMLNH
jgi:MoaA/NifB/PqqE/SkfB family radical SAM enzyme